MERDLINSQGEQRQDDRLPEIQAANPTHTIGSFSTLHELSSDIMRSEAWCSPSVLAFHKPTEKHGERTPAYKERKEFFWVFHTFMMTWKDVNPDDAFAQPTTVMSMNRITEHAQREHSGAIFVPISLQFSSLQIKPAGFEYYPVGAKPGRP
mmetsp:Transcript_374/g.700  ORF Transcript_374/g.700 Transcript_374/m.700 type:complete len:152 (-) Transcript_374:60-515(-)|eukprot:CAMPEP_0175134876 /NCGR_PEP_ID=MMETSP0087-20121206/8414_1 /TAXON_ID=136419 /ORGANISM="Unknown Unknown, Strain D1" /LENGTH=151 /DNA_ID=CAMNT_0016417471 /DNA_START=429 /DNA_END=884 /DNA_ORIENTATION=-